MGSTSGAQSLTPMAKRPDAGRYTSGWPTGRCSVWREVLDSCAIVTTEANALLMPVHDRMPVIIAPEHYARWLDPANAEVDDLVTPYPSDAMAYYPVSTRVNSVRHDDASLIEPAEALEPESADDEPPPHTPEQESLF